MDLTPFAYDQSHEMFRHHWARVLGETLLEGTRAPAAELLVMVLLVMVADPPKRTLPPPLLPDFCFLHLLACKLLKADISIQEKEDMRRSILAAVLVDAFLFSSIALGSPIKAYSKDPSPQIRAYLTRLEGFGFSGAVLVAKDGKILVQSAHGLADRQKQIPMRTDTIFDVGSLTKQFTAAAILALESDGKLRVTDPIAKYLKAVPQDKVGITIHHLLTHTSGLADGYLWTPEGTIGDLGPLTSAPWARHFPESARCFAAFEPAAAEVSRVCFEKRARDGIVATITQGESRVELQKF